MIASILPRWQESYLYTDGLGHEAMTKVQAEPGEAPERDADGNLVYDEDGNLVITHTDNRWVGTGRTVYDNKGNPVKKYEPFFSSTYEYEDEDDLVQWGVTPIMHYDPLGRIVHTEFPDGTESRVVFNAWYQENWDQNDCVNGSRWLTERLEAGAPADERTAAVQTQVHANTPSVSYLDSLGRVYLSVENNGLDENYETRTVLDIEGNVLTITDQRGITAFTYQYDIAGTRVYTNNPDAGERFILIDTMGNPLRTWDSRDQVQRFTYDTLRRSTHTYVQQGVNPEHLMIRTIYGESLADPVNGNHRGKVYQVFDGAGVLTNNSYDFKGNLLGSTRHIANEYHQTPHWDVIDGLTDVNAVWTAAQNSLQSQSYSGNIEYDALNRVVRSTTPDGSVTRPFYNEANLLERIELNHRGRGTFTPIVDNIDYNARGQRTIIEYANGVETSYEYDPFTFRMTRLVSTRSSDSMKLQDYRYTFDPVGNIVVFRDNSDWSHLFTRQPVSGDGQYVYDPLYRLVQATGREHPGQQPTHTDPVRGTVPHQNDLQALLRYTEQYEYDEAGNIIKMSHTAIGNNWNRGYQYSTASNKLIGTSATGDSAGTYSNTYTYNSHGSMITMPHISQLNWNYAEQLQSTDLGGGGIVYYCYDSSGNRSRKVYEHSGVVEDRIYLGGYEIYRRTVGATLSLERETLHVSDDTKPVLLFETKTVDIDNSAGSPQIRCRWQLGNHLGSSGIELNDGAQVISYEEYYPFGSTSFHSVNSGAEVSAKRYRYTGKERDDETGLYYYGARYYASWLGRWTGCDPSLNDSLSLYIYVKNRPVCLIDANGQDSSSFLEKWNIIVADAHSFKSMVYKGIESLENNMISYARESATKQQKAGLISKDQIDSGIQSAAVFTGVVGTALTFISEFTVNAGANFIEFLDNTSTALGEGTGKLVTGNTQGGLKQLGDVTGLITAGENLGEGIYDLTQGNYAEGTTKIAGAVATAAGNVIMFSQLGNQIVPAKYNPTLKIKIKQTGASDNLEFWDFEGAEKSYESIRLDQDDVALISKNTGIKLERVQRIKDHLFNKKHLLDDGLQRFDASPEIANAWSSLKKNSFTCKDIQLLKHELFESKFEGVFKTNYRTAHSAANRAGYKSGLE